MSGWNGFVTVQCLIALKKLEVCKSNAGCYFSGLEVKESLEIRGKAPE